jgi:4-amino-4-deoxy-L-arabinose transferase-like glycosyltransferase
MTASRQHVLLAVILLIYLVLGILFAAITPPWQAPDEPAHYNYVRYLAENRRFPILRMGDYSYDYMEEIKGRRFPPDLSIDPIRYEYHQPPLYYLMAVPVYLLADGELLPLRLLSVALGAGVVFLAYAIGRRVYPNWPGLALAAAAFVAFLPQHLATVSQVGNDILAELLFALVLYQLIGWLRVTSPADDQPPGSGRYQSAIDNPQSTIILGLLLGLILVTKTTAYIAVPLALGVLVWRWRREGARGRRIATDLALVALPAAVIALPWYARNLAVYGWPDFLGLRRHDAVVVGQLRPGEYLAQFGAASYLRRLVEFTFKSFWGVFGWQGVFMDSRIYLAMALLCGMAAAGLILRVAHSVHRRPDALTPGSLGVFQNPQSSLSNRQSLWLLSATILLTLLVYAWYNLQFVQHQGRYLFTALIPIAIFFALGWDEALRRRSSLWIALGLLVVGVILALWGLAFGAGLPRWPLALLVVLAFGLVAVHSIPRSQSAPSRSPNAAKAIRNLVFALPYALLPFLSLYALFGAIVPQLAS